MNRTKNRAECGATAVEYALMVTLVAAVIFGAVATLGTHLIDMFVVAF